MVVGRGCLLLTNHLPRTEQCSWETEPQIKDKNTNTNRNTNTGKKYNHQHKEYKHKYKICITNTKAFSSDRTVLMGLCGLLDHTRVLS